MLFLLFCPRLTVALLLRVPGRILYDIPCKVCRDHSSGKHYGIFACDGCAGFFKVMVDVLPWDIALNSKSKATPGTGTNPSLCLSLQRSIRRNRQYVCKAKSEGSCVVDKTHRNQCRACRLRKCVEAGMNRDGKRQRRSKTASKTTAAQRTRKSREARRLTTVCSPQPCSTSEAPATRRSGARWRCTSRTPCRTTGCPCCRWGRRCRWAAWAAG